MGKKTIPYTERNGASYFHNGQLYYVFPFDPEQSVYENRDYGTRYIVSDGIRHDLTMVEDIEEISVPYFDKENNITVTSLDYYLRMCSGNLYAAKEYECAIACFKKAIEMMPYSGIGWREYDYLQILPMLYEQGRFEEADSCEHYIKSDPVIQEQCDLRVISKKQLDDLKRENDLIVFSSSSPSICGSCSIYTGRVYSVSGKKRNIPKLTPEIEQKMLFHLCCGSSVSPYFEALHYRYMGQEVNILKSTKRPYKDIRTEEQIAQYNDRLNSALSRKRSEKQYLIDLKEFYMMKYRAPDICPKYKTRYINTKRYDRVAFLELKSKAQEKGIILSDIIEYENT